MEDILFLFKMDHEPIAQWEMGGKGVDSAAVIPLLLTCSSVVRAHTSAIRVFVFGQIYLHTLIITIAGSSSSLAIAPLGTVCLSGSF